VTDIPDDLLPDQPAVIGSKPVQGDQTATIDEFSYCDVGLLCPDCGRSTVFGVPVEPQYLRCPECELGRELTRQEKDTIHPHRRGPR
jgi:rubredoxin